MVATALHLLDRLKHIDDDTYEKIEQEIRSGKGTGMPITFEAQAKHLTEASGSPPDNIVARTDYQKGNASVKKTETV